MAEAKSAASDLVIGLGGGSSLDTAKAVAALLTNPGSALDYVGLHRVRNRPLPMIAIPTTAGTGSEVTLWSVFTDDTRSVKAAIGSILLYPAVALCDPDLTMALPPPLTAATGMDALAHAIECYTNNACQPISAALALRAMELIGRHLRSAVLNGRNLESRYAMMLASTMAGIAMNPTRLGLAHALAMPLGSWGLRVPHGVVLALTLPPVMEFNYRAEPDRFVAWPARWAKRSIICRGWRRPAGRSARCGNWRPTLASPRASPSSECARNMYVRWWKKPSKAATSP